MQIVSKVYFVLIAIVAFIPDPSMPIDLKGFHWLYWCIVNTIYLLILFLYSRKEKLIIPSSLVLTSFLIFFGISLLSTAVAFNKIESLVRLTDLYVVLSSLIIVYYFIKNKLINLNILLWIIFFKLFVELLAVYYQLYIYTAGFQVEFSGNFSHLLKSFYGNKNVTSFSFLIQSAISMILYTRLKSRPLRVFIFLTVFATFYILFFISTRAVFATILIMLLTILILFSLKYINNKKTAFNEFKKITVYLFAIIASYLLFNFTNNDENIDVGDRVVSVTQFDNDESVSNRVRFWRQAGESIIENPLLGVGIGNWRIISIKYDAQNIYSYVVPYTVHNDFLEIFAETGVLGIISYLCFFLLLIKKSINNLLEWIKSKLSHYHIYLFLCLIFFMIDANLNFPLSRPLMQIVLILFIATFETLDYYEE